MDNEEWDLEEVQRLKKKRLVHYNVMYAVFLVLFFYVAERMTFASFGALITFLFWGYGLFLLYIFCTGKRIGPTTWRRINEFDKFHKGKKKMKKRTAIHLNEDGSLFLHLGDDFGPVGEILWGCRITSYIMKSETKEGGCPVKINVEIDEELERLEVLIRAKEWDDEVNRLMDRLKEKRRSYFSGTNGETRHVFKPEKILYLYTEEKTVMARTEEGRYRMKERLYELEEELPEEQFVRLSKSAIANLDALQKFEASFNGTLCVYFKNGEKEYVSRRYVSEIKQKIEGKG